MRWLIFGLFFLASYTMEGQESDSYLDCFVEHFNSNLGAFENIDLSFSSKENANNLIILLREQSIKSLEKEDYDLTICLLNQSIVLFELYFPTEDDYIYDRLRLGYRYNLKTNYHDAYILNLATLELLNNWESDDRLSLLVSTYGQLIRSTENLGMRKECMNYRKMILQLTPDKSNVYLDCFMEHANSNLDAFDNIDLSFSSKDNAYNLIILLEEQSIKSFEKKDYDLTICLLNQSMALLELYFPTEDTYIHDRIMLGYCYNFKTNYQDAYILNLATLELVNNWESDDRLSLLEATYNQLIMSTENLGMNKEYMNYRKLLLQLTPDNRYEKYIFERRQNEYNHSKIDLKELIDLTDEYRNINLDGDEESRVFIILLFDLVFYYASSESNKSFQILDELYDVINESKLEDSKIKKMLALINDISCSNTHGKELRLKLKLDELFELYNSLENEYDIMRFGRCIVLDGIGVINNLDLVEVAEKISNIADLWSRNSVNLNNQQLSNLQHTFFYLSEYYYSNAMFDSYVECWNKFILFENRYFKKGSSKNLVSDFQWKKAQVLNDYKYLESRNIGFLDLLNIIQLINSDSIDVSVYYKWYDTRILNKDRTFDLDSLNTPEFKVVVWYDSLSRMILTGKFNEFSREYALLEESKINTKNYIKTEGGLLLYLYTLINTELAGDSLAEVKEMFVRNYPLNVVELTLINEMLDAGKLSDAIKLNLKRELGIRFPKEPEGIQKFPLLADLYFNLEEHLSFHNLEILLINKETENFTINDIMFSSVQHEELCHCIRLDTIFSFSQKEAELIIHEYTEYKSGKEIAQLPNLLNFASTLEPCFDGGKINFVSGDGLMTDINLSLMHTKRGYFYQNYEIEYGYKPQNRNGQKSLEESKSDYVGFGGMVYNELKEPLTEFSALDYIRGKGGNWVYLPGTLYEVEIGSEVFDSSSKFIGVKATESAFRSSLNSKVLHIATHGFTADESGSEPGLVFSYSNSTSLDDDGYLYLSEVLELDLTKVELVVLSACNSGTTNYGEEGEMNRLSDAFLIAGAQNVIFTDDYIDDYITTEFMKRFFKYYADMENVSLAFRRTFKEVALHYPDDFNKWNAFNFKTTR